MVLDQECRVSGLIFWITEIRWLGEEEVEVDGGYQEASESAAGNIYRLEKREGRWEVEDGATVREVLDTIRLDWTILWIVINGRMSGKQTMLHEGDALRITPVVGPVG